jgi:hypothetical protein
MNCQALKHCMNMNYLVGHQGACSVLFQCLSNLLVLIIFWWGYVKCRILYKQDSLPMATCACYLWQIALQEKILVCQHIWQMMEVTVEFSLGVRLVYKRKCNSSISVSLLCPSEYTHRHYEIHSYTLMVICGRVIKFVERGYIPSYCKVFTYTYTDPHQPSK